MLDRAVDRVLERAAATHRWAAAYASAAGAALTPSPGSGPDSGPGATGAEDTGAGPAGAGETDAADTGTRGRGRAGSARPDLAELRHRARVAADQLAPGWLGAPWPSMADQPVGGPAPAHDPASGPPPPRPWGTAAPPPLVPVRLGDAAPAADAAFPVVAPLGHLTVDRDARDPTTAALLRSTLLRLLAADPGGWTVRVVDPDGEVTRGLGALRSSGVLVAPAADHAQLRAVVAAAERWVTFGRPASGRRLLVMLTGWPPGTDPAEPARLAALADVGPAAGLHLLLAGWATPTPPSRADADRHGPGAAAGAGAPARRWCPPLPHATRITVDRDGARIRQLAHGPAPAGVATPVRVDPPPPAAVVDRLCAEVADRATHQARAATDGLLPPVAADFTAPPGLAVVIGTNHDAPVPLRLDGVTGHWLVVGGPASGKSSLLRAVLHGLCGWYRTAPVRVWLLSSSPDRPPDPTGDLADLDPGQSGVPLAQVVRTGPDQRGALPVLRQLTGWLDGGLSGRVVCLIDDVDHLLATGGSSGSEAAAMLSTLAREGGGRGIHLVLAGGSVPSGTIAGHCRVRIALAGGAVALEPGNHAADRLAPGTAVVNTAGGLGGPRGATRAHEQQVRLFEPSDVTVAVAGAARGRRLVPTARPGRP